MYPALCCAVLGCAALCCAVPSAHQGAVSLLTGWNRPADRMEPATDRMEPATDRMEPAEAVLGGKNADAV